MSLIALLCILNKIYFIGGQHSKDIYDFFILFKEQDDRGTDRHTDGQTGIATYRLNRSQSRFIKKKIMNMLNDIKIELNYFFRNN